MDPCQQDVGREGTTKPEHVHVFASRADTSTHVIVLGRTTSRDVWVAVRCAVGEGGTWSAPRSIFLYFDTHWATHVYELYNRF